MKDPGHLAEFRGAYLAEVEELLAAANSNLLTVETATRKGERNARSVRELFRAIHTIKGLSAMVGIEPIVVITHRVETALRIADRVGARLSAGAVDVLFQSIRAIEQRVRMLAEGKPVANPPTALLDALDALDTPAETKAVEEPVELALEPSLLAKLGAAERDQIIRGVADGRRGVRVDFTPSREQADRGVNITVVRERIARLGEIVKVLPLAARTDGKPEMGGLVFALLVLTSAGDVEIAAAASAEPSTVQTLLARASSKSEPAVAEMLDPLDAENSDFEVHHHGVVRVDVARLDEAMERLSALIVTRFRLSRAVAAIAQTGVNVRELNLVLVENARQLRELRASILRLRMVPVGEVLERLRLLVRGLKRSTGKHVKIELNSGGAEVDKAVGERIFPALVHIVRNAVDHAIELPAERRRRGKSDEGTLTVDCVERSNAQLEIAIRDDGCGIDPEELAKRAGRKVPDTDAGLLELLCLPGLSSRDQADVTSGRGMGMDIVKRIIVDQLGGEMLVSTERGVGTTFILRVPLTISIVDAFTFLVGDQHFVVPVMMVEEIVEVDHARLTHGPASPGHSTGTAMLERRGQAVPVVRLDALFDCARTGGGTKALIVRSNGEQLAFAVDRMVAQQEVVVRPLEDPLVKVIGVAGATDLGDGRPTLVLDLVSLSTTFLRSERPS